MQLNQTNLESIQRKVARVGIENLNQEEKDILMLLSDEILFEDLLLGFESLDRLDLVISSRRGGPGS